MEEKDPRGRKTTYSPDVGRKIIAEVRSGESVADAAEHAGTPRSTAYDWLSEGEMPDADASLKEFAERVRQAQTDLKAEREARLIAEANPPVLKSQFSPEVCQRIVHHIRLGNPIGAGADSAGVPRSTVRDWIKRGKREASGPYREFADSVRKARSDFAIRTNLLLNKAANAGSVSAAKYLHQIAARREPIQRSDEDDVPFEIPDLDDTED